MGAQLKLSLNEVSQIAHALAGALAVLGVQALFGPRWVWLAAAAMTLFAAIKEFWFDVDFENAQTAGNGLEDFLFYQAGIAAALILHFAARMW